MPIVASSLADVIRRLFHGVEIIAISQIPRTVKNEDDPDLQFMIIDGDRLLNSPDLRILKLLHQSLLSLRLIVLSEYREDFLSKFLELRSFDIVINSSQSLSDFKIQLLEIIEPNSNSEAHQNICNEVKITKRQRQILILSASGRNNIEISKILEISEHTVKVHAWRMYKRLGVKNRLQALAKAKLIGII